VSKVVSAKRNGVPCQLSRRNNFKEVPMLPTTVTKINHAFREMGIPCARTFSVRVLLKRFARQTFSIERLILLSFLFSLSARKVGQALLLILVERISHTTVSQIGKQLDRTVHGYYERPPFECLRGTFARWHFHETQNRRRQWRTNSPSVMTGNKRTVFVPI